MFYSNILLIQNCNKNKTFSQLTVSCVIFPIYNAITMFLQYRSSHDAWGLIVPRQIPTVAFQCEHCLALPQKSFNRTEVVFLRRPPHSFVSLLVIVLDKFERRLQIIVQLEASGVADKRVC